MTGGSEHYTKCQTQCGGVALIDQVLSIHALFSTTSLCLSFIQFPGIPHTYLCQMQNKRTSLDGMPSAELTILPGLTRLRR